MKYYHRINDAKATVSTDAVIRTSVDQEAALDQSARLRYARDGHHYQNCCTDASSLTTNECKADQQLNTSINRAYYYCCHI